MEITDEIKERFSHFKDVVYHPVGEFVIVEYRYVEDDCQEFEILHNGASTLELESTFDRAVLRVLCISNEEPDAFRYICKMLFSDTK